MKNSTTSIAKQLRIKKHADKIRNACKSDLSNISNNAIWEISQAIKKVKRNARKQTS